MRGPCIGGMILAIAIAAAGCAGCGSSKIPIYTAEDYADTGFIELYRRPGVWIASEPAIQLERQREHIGAAYAVRDALKFADEIVLSGPKKEAKRLPHLGEVSFEAGPLRPWQQQAEGYLLSATLGTNHKVAVRTGKHLTVYVDGEMLSHEEYLTEIRDTTLISISEDGEVHSFTGQDYTPVGELPIDELEAILNRPKFPVKVAFANVAEMCGYDQLLPEEDPLQLLSECLTEFIDMANDPNVHNPPPLPVWQPLSPTTPMHEGPGPGYEPVYRPEVDGDPQGPYLCAYASIYKERKGLHQGFDRDYKFNYVASVQKTRPSGGMEGCHFGNFADGFRVTLVEMRNGSTHLGGDQRTLQCGTPYCQRTLKEANKRGSACFEAIVYDSNNNEFMRSGNVCGDENDTLIGKFLKR